MDAPLQDDGPAFRERNVHRHGANVIDRIRTDRHRGYKAVKDPVKAGKK
jgi:hypothetical protein